MNATLATPDLATTWAEFRAANPKVRIRDAAAALGVSEAELVATGCGDNVVRLRPEWYTMLFDFEGLGEVMALTRNDVFVHEKTGHYRKVQVFEKHRMGQTLDENVDLRIFFRNWHHAFAVTNETSDGVRRSLQFFDAVGVAVHKIHLRRKSNVAHFEAIVETYRHEDQRPHLDVEPAPEPKADAPDDTIAQDALRASWSELKDTHDFIFLLRKYGVSRLQAFRLAGADYAWQVSNDSFRQVLEAASETQLPVMIFAGNHGCIQIHTGPIKKLKAMHGWYNILDPGFNLHVKDQEIVETWVVRKPTKDGDVHSLECFDAQGRVLCYLFGRRKEGQTELTEWRQILSSLTPR